jgi:hypothetical protein
MLVKSLKKRLAKDGIKSSKTSKRWENKKKTNFNQEKLKTIGKILVINGKNQKLKNLKNFKIL